MKIIVTGNGDAILVTQGMSLEIERFGAYELRLCDRRGDCWWIVTTYDTRAEAEADRDELIEWLSEAERALGEDKEIVRRANVRRYDRKEAS